MAERMDPILPILSINWDIRPFFWGPFGGHTIWEFPTIKRPLNKTTPNSRALIFKDAHNKAPRFIETAISCQLPGPVNKSDRDSNEVLLYSGSWSVYAIFEEELALSGGLLSVVVLLPKGPGARMEYLSTITAAIPNVQTLHTLYFGLLGLGLGVYL